MQLIAQTVNDREDQHGHTQLPPDGSSAQKLNQSIFDADWFNFGQYSLQVTHRDKSLVKTVRSHQKKKDQRGCLGPQTVGSRVI